MNLISLKLWLGVILLHVLTAGNQCFGRRHVLQDDVAVIHGLDTRAVDSGPMDKAPHLYFFAHDETRIATARAKATRIRGSSSGAFPDVKDNPMPDGCNWDYTMVSELSVGVVSEPSDVTGIVEVEFLAVDSCVTQRYVWYRERNHLISSQPWSSHIELNRVREKSYKVLVLIRLVGLEILAEGVYDPATGTMHLLGCAPEEEITRLSREFSIRLRDGREYLTPGTPIPIFSFGQDQYFRNNNLPPLMNDSEVCAIAVTLQYPPLNSRWNSQRALKVVMKSTSGEDDKLYFDPVERSLFHHYYRHDVEWQRRLETAVHMFLLILGLVFVALQVQHGRSNEEALPFVSLVMLGIQIANHVSQMAIFKDMQIGHYLDFKMSTMMPHEVPKLMASGKYNESGIFSFLDSSTDFQYYGAMAWHSYVPYQAITMAAIFLYVWIFHRVGDRRRILRKRRSSKLPPSEVEVALAVMMLFYLVGFLGFCITFHNGKSTSDDSEVYYDQFAPAPWNEQFVAPRFYELSKAQWGVVNKVTGLVVSLFLLPQLLGNWKWQVQGRPLSAWFYIGIPSLQTLPHIFTIAKHFQLLPIFTCYDPYLDSLYGIYQGFSNFTPWWPIGVVVSSTILVLVVHFQFATSSRVHSTNIVELSL